MRRTTYSEHGTARRGTVTATYGSRRFGQVAVVTWVNGDVGHVPMTDLSVTPQAAGTSEPDKEG